MKDLDTIAQFHGTDKATVFTRTYAKPKGYTLHYEKFFEPLRDQPIKLLEVGVGGGESIRTWLEYFPRAKVYGIDNVTDTNPWNTPHATVTPHPRYKFVHGDQTDRTMYKCFAADHGSDFDVIIDDGGHYNDQTILSLSGLWPIVKSGGFYAIEDLGVDSPGSVFIKTGWVGHLEFLRLLTNELDRGEGGIASVYRSPELAILRKK